MTRRRESGAKADAGLTTRRATGAEQRAALRYEAALLQMLRHPGVTEVIRVTEADGVTELTTRSGGDRTLAEWDGTEGETVDTAVIAGVLAALATTCADLHGLGVVHGRIEPQRVTIPPSGQPVLTGFGAAGPIGSPRRDADPPLPPFCDPAAVPARPLEPSTDVFGLGALLEHLLERHQPTATDSARSARRRLRRVARSATDEAPDRRPDAATLATAILEAAPAAHLPGDTAPPPPPEASAGPGRLERPPVAHEATGSRRGVRPFIAAGALVLVAVVALLALGRGRPRAASETATVSGPRGAAPMTAPIPSTRPRTRADAPPPSTTTSTTTPTTTTTPAAPAPSTTGPPASLPIAGTSLVDFEGVHYEIGGGQRRWAIGDWDCDGAATLATLDPSSGALTFFEDWPEAGSTQAVAADRVPGAVDLRAEPVDGCDQLSIVHGDRIDTYQGTGSSP
jgi:serine/threonine-protein kinase